MKQAFGLLALATAALQGTRWALGDEAALALATGATALMALMIAATFLWLYAVRATPLALGMAFSWLGWGLFAVAPEAPQAALAVLALCLVGAVLHFAVIHRSCGGHGARFLWPVALALLISAGHLVLR